jgi:mxaJ protein
MVCFVALFVLLVALSSLGAEPPALGGGASNQGPTSSLSLAPCGSEQEDGQWLMAPRNYANTRYSGLDPINISNVTQLNAAGTFSIPVLRGQEAAPIVVGNTRYVGSPLPNLAAATNARPVLRIGADPNNLPFSNRRLEGFENQIAALVAQELGASIEYTWLSQRLGFFRGTIGKQGACDLVMAVPKGFGQALTTDPYYRSSFVFVQRRHQDWRVHSYDDPRLRSLKIGVQVAPGENPPPLQALVNRQIITNLVGFTLLSDAEGPNPAAQMVEGVVKGELDLAIIWGPWAGYFAQQQQAPVELEFIAAENDGPNVPFAFEICLGVRKSRPELRDQLNQILEKKRFEIQRILQTYGVPERLVSPAQASW